MTCKKAFALVALAALAVTFVSWCSAPRQDAPSQAPAATPVADSALRPAPVRLLFAGDMMQHGPQLRAAYDSVRKTYDYSPYFEHIGKLSKEADVAVCNLEVTLRGKPYSGYPQFSSPDEYFKAIAAAGYDVFLTANNHCLDCGRKGLERTIAKLRDAGLAQIGTYEDSLDRVLRYPAVMEVNGHRLSFLNYTYGTNGLKPTAGNVVNYIDTAVIAADVVKARSLGAEFVIACVHWGVENVFEPNLAQRRLAKWLIEKGVDHVIGGHPHVVQPAELITTPDGRRHLVVYSLGNVISNMKNRGNDGGMLLGMTLGSDNYNDAADGAWWVAFHAPKPRFSGLKNYTAFPAGFPASKMPASEVKALNDFVLDARSVMAKGDSITEKNYENWGW